MDDPPPQAKRARTAKKPQSIPHSVHHRYRWDHPEIEIPGKSPETIIDSLSNQLRQWELSQVVVKEGKEQNAISEEDYKVYKDLIWEKLARLWGMFVSLSRQHDRLIKSGLHDAVDYDWGVETAFAVLLTNHFSMKDATAGSDVRSKHKQARWAESLRECYDAFKPEDKSRTPRLTWCPIVQDWLPQQKCCAAHIVPYSIGHASAAFMFGNPEAGEDILWDTRNGLWISKTVEKVFDTGKAVIMHLTESSDNRFKLVVLDTNLLENNANFGDRHQYK